VQTNKLMVQLLSQDDWDSLQETLYLQSIPGLVQSIRAAEQSDDWVSEEEFLRTLEEMDDSTVCSL